MVGLGPAGADLVLPAALDAFARVPVRFARTARHPAVDDLAAQGITFTALDQLYDHGDDLDAVYSAIASYVVDAAHTHGEVVYAVPGSPNVAEKTVLLLRAANVEVEIVPGVSFADLAWARLGIDPLAGVRVVDARAFAIDAAGHGRTDAHRSGRHGIRALGREARTARGRAARPRCHGAAATRPARRAHPDDSRSPTSTARSNPIT